MFSGTYGYPDTIVYFYREYLNRNKGQHAEYETYKAAQYRLTLEVAVSNTLMCHS